MTETGLITSKKNLIKNRILQLVETSWGNNKQAYLVANIGSRLSKEFNLRKDLDGLKLADFIKKELSDQLEFIDSPKDQMIKALVPAKAELNEDLTTHFSYPKSSEKTAGADYQRININRSIWKAFSSELNEGKFRHIKLGPEIHFQDTNEANSPEGYHFIESTLINPTRSQAKKARDETIQKNIFEWAKNNSVDVDSVLIKGNECISSHSQKTAFSLLIESLDPRDYARINMPLDIVVKLQNKIL